MKLWHLSRSLREKIPHEVPEDKVQSGERVSADTKDKHEAAPYLNHTSSTLAQKRCEQNWKKSFQGVAFSDSGIGRQR